MPEEIKLSIIIVSWNVRDFLRGCLESVFANIGMEESGFEVHVVDNASTDGSADLVRRDFPSVRLTAYHENLGFARANNLAAQKCRGEMLLLLNPDTEVPPGAIVKLCQCLADHPGAAIVGSRLVYPDGTVQRNAGGAFPNLRNVAWNYLFLDKILPASFGPEPFFLRADRQGTFAVDWVSGAVMLLRRTDVSENIFDERFFMFAEDMDLCNRMHKTGRQVLYTSDVTIVHHHGVSTKRQPSPQVLSCEMEAPRSFFAMRHGRLALKVYDFILFAGYFLRWMIYAAAAMGRRNESREWASVCRRRTRTALGWILNLQAPGISTDRAAQNAEPAIPAPPDPELVALPRKGFS